MLSAGIGAGMSSIFVDWMVVGVMMLVSVYGSFWMNDFAELRQKRRNSR
jgi:hypothetical protein